MLQRSQYTMQTYDIRWSIMNKLAETLLGEREKTLNAEASSVESIASMMTKEGVHHNLTHIPDLDATIVSGWDRNISSSLTESAELKWDSSSDSFSSEGWDRFLKL